MPVMLSPPDSQLVLYMEQNLLSLSIHIPPKDGELGYLLITRCYFIAVPSACLVDARHVDPRQWALPMSAEVSASAPQPAADNSTTVNTVDASCLLLHYGQARVSFLLFSRVNGETKLQEWRVFHMWDYIQSRKYGHKLCSVHLFW